MNTTTASTSNNREALGGGDASTTAVTGQSTSVNNVNQVIVEGGGVSMVNGTYTKVVGQMYDGAPVYAEGHRIIYRNSTSMGPCNWFIGYWNGFNSISAIGKVSPHYGSTRNADSVTPPTNGWMPLNGWLSPAPKVRIVTANNDANSEGAQKVSGSKRSSSTVGKEESDILANGKGDEDKPLIMMSTKRKRGDSGNSQTQRRSTAKSSIADKRSSSTGPSSNQSSLNAEYQVMASSDAWKLLIKQFGFSLYGGKYCFPGKDNRPRKDTFAVQGVNYFSTIEELRKHLRIQGLPEATDIDGDLVDNLLQWISYEGEVPYDNKKPPSARDRRTALSLASSSIPNHLVVKECGNVELNGRYQAEQFKIPPTKGFDPYREYNGAPVYTKKGEWKGKKVTFAIFREVYSSNKPLAWYIAQGHAFHLAQEEKRILFKCQTNRPLPPESGWVIIGGAEPAPTLSVATEKTNKSMSPPPSQSPLKKCGSCGKPKKKHSYRAVEWNKIEDNQRKCRVCL